MSGGARSTAAGRPEPCCRPAERTRYIDDVPWSCIRTVNSLGLGHRAEHNDIGNDHVRRGASVAALQGTPIALCQVKESLEETVYPTLRYESGQAKRKEAGEGFPAHGGDIAQSASQ